jgi:hypothetical protein
MSLHFKALGAVQLAVLRRLGAVASAKRFYLGGGTAVALHLGHRRSLDLDWFTEKEFGDPVVLARHIQDKGIPLVVRQIDRGTLHGTISGVRVSFLEYRYASLRRPARASRLTGELASLPDLSAMKLSAIAQRGARKDFIDVYAMASRFASLSRMLAYYQRKYGIADLGHVLYSLTYFDEAEREHMPRMLRRMDWRTIKRAFREWVADLAR